jgi:short-chain fatty acids transporter
MPFLTRIAVALNRFSEKWLPSSLAIVGILTFVTFALAWGLTEKTPIQIVGAWGDGFWRLLEFAMQMSLMMVTGSLLAESPALRRGFDALARVPKTPRGAVVWLAFLSMAICYLHWGLGLIASAFLARRLAVRHPKVHYPLLVAVGYWGMGTVWHAGLSGSAPLLIASPKHFMEDSVGVIPLSETIFSPFNLGLVLITAAAMLALAWALYPKEAHGLAEKDLAELREKPAAFRPGRNWLISGGLGLVGLLWLAQDAHANGFGVTFNKLNLLFLSLSLILYPSPEEFTASAEKAVGYVHGIIVQYPLYAGIYGIIKGSGLDILFGSWFVKFSTVKTFPIIVYWYSAVLNYFIPSAGSKFAVEAPFVLEAAKTLGVPYAKIVLAYCWGDMVTDLIQPFFCLPLLAIAKVDFKDVLGYEMIAMVVCSALGTAAFLLY